MRPADLGVFLTQFKPLIDDIDAVVQQLGLSLSNLDHFSAMIDYYTPTKLRRFDKMTRSLYLVCYLHLKYRQVTEYLADAFIHHCRKLQQEAKQYADNTAYQEWKDACGSIREIARRLIRPRHLPFVTTGGSINPVRFEVLF